MAVPADAPKRPPDIVIKVNTAAAAQAKARPPYRPSTYTEELGDRICDLIADGMTVREIAKLPDMPGRRTINRWIRQYESMAAAYHDAKRDRIEALQAEIFDIVDCREPDENGIIDRSKPVPSQDLSSDKRAHIDIRVAKRELCMANEAIRKNIPFLTSLEDHTQQVLLPGSTAGDEAKEINPDDVGTTLESDPIYNAVFADLKPAPNHKQ